MGTRCITIIYSEWNNKPICAMYRQFDGYLEGHGLELREKFGDFQIINGIPYGQSTKNKANGMGCLAAQIVAHFKTEIGGFYMVSPDDYQEYNYHLHFREGKLWVEVRGYDNENLIFEGWLSELPDQEEDGDEEE